MFTRTAQILLSTLVALSGCASDLDVKGEVTDVGLTGDPGGEYDGDGAGDSGEGDGGTAHKSDEAPPEALLACDLEFACEFPMELVRREQATKYADSDACAIRALVSGQIALIQTIAVFPNAEAYRDHVIDVDGSVLRQAHGRADDVGLWQKPVERCSLQDPAFFADCALNFDARCLDPDKWIVEGSCEPLGSLTCPAP